MALTFLLATVAAVLFLLPLAEDVLLDLAGGGFGELAELDGGGGFEAGDAFLGELYDLFFGGLLALLEGHVSFGAFAPVLVRYGGDGDLHDGRVLGNDLLDLYRGDVLSAGDDHVLVPIPYLDVPVRVPRRYVARVVPTALERLFGLLLVVEVALHDHVAPEDDLAHRLPVARYVVHVVVDDAHEVRGDVALALAREELGMLLGVELLPLLARGTRGCGAVGLREAVEVYGPYVQLEELAEQGRRGHVAGDGGGDFFVERVGVLVICERYLDGRRRAVVGYTLGLKELPYFVRLDLS